MIKTQWILIIVLLTGVLILALPDQGNPVISFNKMHGPSLQDLVGLMLILISWMVSTVMVVRNRKRIRNRLGKRNTSLYVVIYLLSCLGISMALVVEADWLLWSFASAALIVNMLFIAISFSKNQR